MSTPLFIPRRRGNNLRQRLPALPLLGTLIHRPPAASANYLLLMLWAAFAQLLPITYAQAWTPFETKSLYVEVEISAAEAKKVQYAAGWSTQSDTELLVEIKNNLSGPLACHGVTVHLLNGSTVSKSFLPRLYVPNAATRQGAVGGVKKGQMKDFSVLCHCWKKPGDSVCGNPQNK